jgi:hypothetical protein
MGAQRRMWEAKTTVATMRAPRAATGRAGVPPLTAHQLRARHVVAVAVGVLPHDARQALVWLRRGPVATSPLLRLAVRRTSLRLCGVKIGAMVSGLERCYFDSSNVSIGTGSFINAGCWYEADQDRQ